MRKFLSPWSSVVPSHQGIFLLLPALPDLPVVPALSSPD
jgi:hypothetical protein